MNHIFFLLIETPTGIFSFGPSRSLWAGRFDHCGSARTWPYTDLDLNSANSARKESLPAHLCRCLKFGHRQGQPAVNAATVRDDILTDTASSCTHDSVAPLCTSFDSVG